jgi:hypothetical protein
VKRFGKDEPIKVVIHIFMETTQRISLNSYPYLKLARPPCFPYCLLCFIFNKFREQEGGTGSSQRWEEGGLVEKGGPNNVYTCK